MGEVCTRAATGSPIGFCKALDQLCTVTADCFGGQRCEVLGSDAFGRCVSP